MILELIIIIIGFVIILSLFYIFKRVRDNRLQNLNNNKKKVTRYVIDDKISAMISIKDRKKCRCICEFMTGDKKLNKELAELCLERLENNDE